MLSADQLPEDVRNLLQQFIIPQDRLTKISEDIEAELKLGLQEGATTNGRTSIAMLPSYVPALPDGTGLGELMVLIGDEFLH